MKRFCTLFAVAMFSIFMYAQTVEVFKEWVQEGNNAAKQKQFQKAFHYYLLAQKECEKKRLVNKLYGNILDSLAICCSKQHQYSQALEFELKALDAYCETLGVDNICYATSLANIAFFYYNLRDYQKATEYGVKATRQMEGMVSSRCPDYFNALNNLSLSYSYLGNYTQSIEKKAKVLEILRDSLGLKHPRYFRELRKMIDYCDKNGDYSKAMFYTAQVIEIMKETQESKRPRYVRAIRELINYCTKLGNYSKALEYEEKLLPILKDSLSENSYEYAKSIGNLASYYSKLGNRSKSIIYGAQSMKIIENISHDFLTDSIYAISLANLAGYYSDLGDYSKAIQYATKAMEIRKTIKSSDYPKSLSNLALYHFYNKEYNKALKFGEMAVASYEISSINTSRDYFTALGNLAGSYSKCGNNPKAIEYGIKVLKLRKELLGVDHPDYAASLNSLAVYNFKQGNYTAAVDYGNQAMQKYLSIRGESHHDYVNSLMNLATYYSFLNENAQSLLYAKTALSIIKTTILRQFSSLPASQRLLYWYKYSHYFTNHFPSLTYKSGQLIASDLYNLSALFAKGLLLTTEIEMNKLILESGDEEALSMFEELRNQRLLLKKLYDMPLAERHINADSLVQTTNLLESKLVERSKVFGDFTHKLQTTWMDVQNALEKDEIAIEFISFNVLNTDSTMIAAITLRKDDKTPKFIPLFEKRQIEAVGDRPFLKEINKKHFICPEVEEMVWTPLKDQLFGIRRIYFAPAGILHSIGIEYLPGMENYEMCRLSTTKEIIDMKESDNKLLFDNTIVTLYGGINYETTRITPKAHYKKSKERGLFSRSISVQLHRDFVDNLKMINDSLVSLKGTLHEVKKIKKSLKKSHRQATIFTGKSATETSVKNLSVNAPQILHIATHGKYYTMYDYVSGEMPWINYSEESLNTYNQEDNALSRSVLFFAGANRAIRKEDMTMDTDDGILTAQEISKLDLRGIDMVVLSACETGKGDVTQGEGVFGLQRGFKKAGVRSIVMSLWEVDDHATEMLMTQFYKNLCNGIEKHEALYSAQKYMRNYKDKKGEKIFNYPHYWAGFLILD